MSAGDDGGCPHKVGRTGQEGRELVPSAGVCTLCSGPDEQVFRVCRPQDVSHNHASLPGSYGHYANEWAGLCPSETYRANTGSDLDFADGW